MNSAEEWTKLMDDLPTAAALIRALKPKEASE